MNSSTGQKTKKASWKSWPAPALYALLIVFIFAYVLLKNKGDVRKVTDRERANVVYSIGILLQENYIFPEMADSMSARIISNLRKGLYQSITSPEDYADKLTQDLQSVSHDKHIRVVFNKAREGSPASKDNTKSKNDINGIPVRDNYGFKDAKILDGNIGYLDLRFFADTSIAKNAALTTMNYLCGADALIIDLRNNRGGSPAMVALILSYFFTDKPVHLNSFYWRRSNRTTETWTLPKLPGILRPDIDLYILTGSLTFSGGEEFAYDLKNLKRATLIGETTGGGANIGGEIKATRRFKVFIPFGRAVNPITKTNWEGIGVEPDIKTTSETAFDTAKIKALKKLKEMNLFLNP
jgi:retinol-binding protein 3